MVVNVGSPGAFRGRSTVQASAITISASRAPGPAAPARGATALTDTTTASAATARGNSVSVAAIDPAEQAQLAELRNRDRQVRAHERAHLAAAGGLATSGPNYSLQIGPDGRLYAVGGGVDIDTSPVAGDPEATIDKARQIIAAALAPAQPSSQDLKIAAQAAAMELRARVELALREREQAGYDATARRERESGGLLFDAWV